MASILCFGNLKALVGKRGSQCPQSQICPWHQDPPSRVWYWWMGQGEQMWVGDSFPGTPGFVPGVVLRGSSTTVARGTEPGSLQLTGYQGTVLSSLRLRIKHHFQVEKLHY